MEGAVTHEFFLNHRVSVLKSKKTVSAQGRLAQEITLREQVHGAFCNGGTRQDTAVFRNGPSLNNILCPQRLPVFNGG